MSQMTAIVDKLLTEVSVAYIPSGYISEALLPGIPVMQTTGKLAKYSNSHLRVQANSLMGGRGRARRVDTITRSQSTYEVERHGLEGIITKDDYRNVERPYDAEKDETVGLTTALWLEKERALASALGDPAVLTQFVTLAGVQQYNDYTNSDPLANFKTAQLAVKAGCGLPANVAIVPWEVAQTLYYHPQILDRLGGKYNQVGGVTAEMLKLAMGVEKIFIPTPTYNSSKEGQADSLAPVWGKDVIFAVIPDAAAPYQVSLGYYLTMKDEGPRQVYKQALINPPGAMSIIVQDSYDYLLSNTAAAYLINDAIA